jgi:hypothetical protein
MRVFGALYPVAVARLFQYFLTNVAEGVGINPPRSEFVSVVRKFALWIVYTTRILGAGSQHVLEFQRHCRLGSYFGGVPPPDKQSEGSSA